jgi:hypothetical protein
MDTTTVGEIAETLTNTLLSGEYADEALRSIAQAGTQTVRERFDIRPVARSFAKLYLDVASTPVSGRN